MGPSSAPVSPQDGCGANNSQPSFTVLTENVVCGKSGVTCSRAIKIFLGVSGPGTPAPRAPRPGLSVPPDPLSAGQAAVSPGAGQLCEGKGFSQKPHPQPLVQFPPFSGTFRQPQFLEDRPPAESRPGQAQPTRSLNRWGPPASKSLGRGRRAWGPGSHVTAPPHRVCPSCWRTGTTRSAGGTRTCGCGWTPAP